MALYRMRLWCKHVGDHYLPAVQKPNWMSKIHPMAREWSDAEMDLRLAAIPTEGRHRLWYRTARDPFTADEREAAMVVLGDMPDRIEDTAAETGWIVGDAFPLADIPAAPYVKRTAD